MHTDEELIPISALNQFLYCKRRCALIHVERVWLENRFTAEGRIIHERVDSGKRESRRDIRVAYSLSLRSVRLGLVGKADVVEFHLKKLPDGKTGWQPFPVEYKRGQPKKDNCDKIQLCAQAICLEEMLGNRVDSGALFYGKTRRRLDVDFDSALRLETEKTAKQLHELIAGGRTPTAAYSRACDQCSLLEACLPNALGSPKSVSRYLKGVIGNH